jgi:hypothetical protein
MANNFTANPGAGGVTFASDDVAGAHYPISKIAYGAEDSATIMNEKFATEATLAALQTIENAIKTAVEAINAKTTAVNTGAIAGTVALDAPTLAALESITAVGPLTNTELRASAVPVSAASLPLPTGAATETTLAAVNTKTPALGSAAATASSPVTLPNDLVVGAAASIAALNIDLLTGSASGWFDAANFHSVSVQIIGSAGITAGAILFEQTNDTTAAAAGNVWAVEEITTLSPTPNIAAITIAASTTRLFAGSVLCRYVRVRVSTAFATANVQAIAAFSQLPYNRMVQTVAQATTANLGVNVAALPAGANAIGDLGLQVRANATGAATVAKVTSAATTNATSVKASAGRLLGYQFTNTTAAIKVVRFYNLSVAPTVGTSVPYFVLYLPASATVNFNFLIGLSFATGIAYAITNAIADLDATAVAANDVLGSIYYA